MKTCSNLNCKKPLPTSLDEYGPDLLRPVCRDCFFSEPIDELDAETTEVELRDNIKEAESEIADLEDEISSLEDDIREWKAELRDLKSKSVISSIAQTAQLSNWKNSLPLKDCNNYEPFHLSTIPA